MQRSLYNVKHIIENLLSCRPDHNLQDIRAKIFPFKRRKINATEVPPITLPVRRKERSLSSLVISTPRVAAQTSLTGRRTKAARRASASSRGIGSTANESAKEANNVEDRDESKKINTSETLMKMAQNKKQVKKRGFHIFIPAKLSMYNYTLNANVHICPFGVQFITKNVDTIVSWGTIHSSLEFSKFKGQNQRSFF